MKRNCTSLYTKRPLFGYLIYLIYLINLFNLFNFILFYYFYAFCSCDKKTRDRVFILI